MCTSLLCLSTLHSGVCGLGIPYYLPAAACPGARYAVRGCGGPGSLSPLSHYSLRPLVYTIQQLYNYNKHTPPNHARATMRMQRKRRATEPRKQMLPRGKAVRSMASSWSSSAEPRENSVDCSYRVPSWCSPPLLSEVCTNRSTPQATAPAAPRVRPVLIHGRAWACRTRRCAKQARGARRTGRGVWAAACLLLVARLVRGLEAIGPKQHEAVDVPAARGGSGVRRNEV
jgi:hypothetical protein